MNRISLIGGVSGGLRWSNYGSVIVSDRSKAAFESHRCRSFSISCERIARCHGNGRSFCSGFVPIRLILPAWLQTILALSSQDRQTSNSQAHPAKTRGTRTVQPNPVPSGF